LVDEDTGKIVAEKVMVAESFFSRFRGLMLRRRLGGDEALLFRFKKPGRHSVHMFFVRFPIDLVYLDLDSKVVEVRTWLKPWRLHLSKVDSKYLLEAPAGTVSRLNIRIGHKILET